MEYINIENEEQYEEVTNRIEQLKNAKPGTDEAKELKVLVKMLVNYEKQQMRRHTEALSH